MGRLSETVILADWGNSSGRLFLWRDGHIIDRAQVSGAKNTSDHAALFSAATQDWPDVDVWLCGGVTSNIGWTETGYASCPARLCDLVPGLKRRGRLTFVPGSSITRGALGYFDTVRGEDIQAHGWSALTGETSATLCLPGTHTKWVEYSDAAITQIRTGLSGELFEIINQNSMLTRGAIAQITPTQITPTKAFDAGLDAMRAHPRPALGHMLMSVRTQQIAGDLQPQHASDYLSGLIIGEDCVAALDTIPHTTRLHLIGDGEALRRYDHALIRMGRQTQIHSGEACAIAGLLALRALTI